MTPSPLATGSVILAAGAELEFESDPSLLIRWVNLSRTRGCAGGVMLTIYDARSAERVLRRQQWVAGCLPR
jgi:hypothetical protein